MCACVRACVCVCVSTHMCVQCSAPAASSDVVTPLSVSCCVSRGVLRSWMLSPYRCWGWWASGTDNTLIAQWWTAGKLFSFALISPPPLNTMTTCCKWSAEGVCALACFCTYDCRIGGWSLFEKYIMKWNLAFMNPGNEKNSLLQRKRGEKSSAIHNTKTFDKKCELIFLILPLYFSFVLAIFFLSQLYPQLLMLLHKLFRSFQWLFGYSQMSLAFFYSPLVVACGGKANILCVNSQHETF